MGVNKELRSRKRQTTRLAYADVPPVNSLPPGQAIPLESQVHSESGTWGMPACKKDVNHLGADALEEKKDFTRESCANVSNKPFIRKYSRVKGNSCNIFTGKLGTLNMASAKQEFGITSEENFDDLFPEHNDNDVDNLQVSRGMNKAISETSPSPAMKDLRNCTLISSVEHGSNKVVHVVESEATNKIYTKIEE